MRNISIIPFIILVFEACGGSPNGSIPIEEETSEATVTITDSTIKKTFAVDSETALPECTEDNIQQLIYVKSTGLFKICNNLVWDDIDITGHDSLVSMKEATLIQCPHKGQVIESGLDKNNNSGLDSAEVSSTTIICNGSPGDKGEQGIRGGNGIDGQEGKDGKDGGVGGPGANGTDGTDYSSESFALYEKYKESIFRLTITTNTTIIQATGFLCYEDYICTAHHPLNNNGVITHIDVNNVYPDVDTTQFRDPLRLTWPVPVSFDADHDLAKIHLNGYSLPDSLKSLPIESSDEWPITMTPTFVMSFMLFLTDLHSDIGNVVSNFVGTCYEGSWDCVGSYYEFATSNDTDGGSSGAPVFNPSTGKVIGVVLGGPEKEFASANWSWSARAHHLDSL